MEEKHKTIVWWEKLLANPEKLHAWLCRLHNTEKEAEEKFDVFADTYCAVGSREYKAFKTIAEQENNHGKLIESVLETMGVELETGKFYPERYWKHAKKCVKDRETAAGAGYFAEDLSLQRMSWILKHEGTPRNLQEMFIPIHRDEANHVRILKKIAGDYGIAGVIDCHTAGLEELGLKLQQK